MEKISKKNCGRSWNQSVLWFQINLARTLKTLFREKTRLLTELKFHKTLSVNNFLFYPKYFSDQPEITNLDLHMQKKLWREIKKSSKKMIDENFTDSENCCNYNLVGLSLSTITEMFTIFDSGSILSSI